MYKVRFHLARGKHYQHWQVKDKCGDVEYYNPEEVTLIMKECKLHNQPNATKKILLGENKRPCAWVICEKVEVTPKDVRPFSDYVLAFNPRMSWHWKVINEGYMEPLVLGYNMDFKEFSFLATHQRQIYCFRHEFIENVS
jgi:hypothetical protein